MLCTPVNLTIGNSYLFAVFAFPDFLPSDLLQWSIYIYMPIFAVIHLHLHDAIYAPLWTSLICVFRYPDFKLAALLQWSIYIYMPIFAVIHLLLHDAIYAPLWT